MDTEGNTQGVLTSFVNVQCDKKNCSKTKMSTLHFHKGSTEAVAQPELWGDVMIQAMKTSLVSGLSPKHED